MVGGEEVRTDESDVSRHVPSLGLGSHRFYTSPRRQHRKTHGTTITRVKKLALPLVAACWLLLAAAPLSAQGPAADWRRLETAHYRFSYPAAAEDFTRHIAARLEAIRERVAAEVGYRSEDRTEVLVIDPLAAANGSAWPLQGWPRLILFATPPGPDSLLGHFDDWSTLLGLHEATHLAHLLRPSRQKAEARLGALVPLGPLTRRAPRWVIEGYATYLEGQLSGYGRPQGDYRPALLRRWAQLGYLPAYGELNGAPRRFLGGSFAYLVGSAFLEWLVAREGDDSLRHLWARLSAKEGRDFDSAFAGVFGDNPANLYRRFCAELTYQAMLAEAEQALSPGRGSELWQKLGGRPSPPSQSADGEKLAVVLHPLGEPARLVVYATAADAEAAQRDQQRRAKLQQRDPEDVPAVRRDPLPAKVLHELRAKSGGDFLDPRFFADGSALLLSRLEPADDGRLIPDLYRFDLARGALRRLTVGAGLRDADPLPDGRRAIALRYQYGRAELLLVDLESGGETRLEAPPFPTALAQPKVAPDGRSLALLAHRDGAWRLEIRPLDPVEGQIGADRGVDLPPAATITDPAFSTDGRYLYATVGSGGQLDLYRFELAGSGRLGPGERQSTRLSSTSRFGATAVAIASARQRPDGASNAIDSSALPGSTELSGSSRSRSSPFAQASANRADHPSSDSPDQLLVRPQ